MFTDKHFFDLKNNIPPEPQQGSKKDHRFWILVLFFIASYMTGLNTGVGFGFIKVPELYPIALFCWILLFCLGIFLYKPYRKSITF